MERREVEFKRYKYNYAFSLCWLSPPNKFPVSEFVLSALGSVTTPATSLHLALYHLLFTLPL